MVSLWDICNSSWCQRLPFLLSFFHFVKTYQNSSSNVYKFFRGEFHILPYHYFLTNLILTDVTISSKKWCHLYNLWHYFEIYVFSSWCYSEIIFERYFLDGITFIHFFTFATTLDSSNSWTLAGNLVIVMSGDLDSAHIAGNVGWWWYYFKIRSRSAL